MFEINEHPTAFFDSTGNLFCWESGKSMPDGWTGIAKRGETLFFVGRDGIEMSYTALQAKTMADAAHELSGRIILVFNGLRFLELGSRADHSVHRAHGLYQKNASGIHLYKLDGTLKAYLVTSRERGFFAVTATKYSTGEVRYMHAACSSEELWLGLEGKGMSEEYDLVRGIQYDVAHLHMKVAS